MNLRNKSEKLKEILVKHATPVFIFTIACFENWYLLEMKVRLEIKCNSAIPRKAFGVDHYIAEMRIVRELLIIPGQLKQLSRPGKETRSLIGVRFQTVCTPRDGKGTRISFAKTSRSFLFFLFSLSLSLSLSLCLSSSSSFFLNRHRIKMEAYFVLH